MVTYFHQFSGMVLREEDYSKSVGGVSMSFKLLPGLGGSIWDKFAIYLLQIKYIIKNIDAETSPSNGAICNEFIEQCITKTS